MNSLTFERELCRRQRFRRPWLWKPRYETELMIEELTFVAPIYPATNNGTQYSNTVDMSKYNRLMFHCGTGTVGGGGSCLFQLQQTNNSNGQGNTNVAASNSGTTSGAAVSVTISGSSQSGQIECRADHLTRRYAQLSAIVSTNASLDYAFGWASEARQHPAGTSSSNADASLQTTSGALNQFYA